MPKKTKKQEKFYLLNISELIRPKINMSLREIQRKLEERGIHLTIGYISKLRDRVLNKITEEIDREIADAAKVLKRTAAKIIHPFNSGQDTMEQNSFFTKIQK